MRFLRTILLLCGILMSIWAWGQQRNSAYQQYIDKYTDAAVEQMRRHKIPASITLAQALLESAAGKSHLAVHANNHFGIKVGIGWTGPYIRRDDDRKAERFRKYKNVAESYEDHSLFLQQPRYKRLFDLNPLDYKGWARGLKACGYATSPTYANCLITIIETYDLNDLDEDRFGLKNKKRYVTPVTVASVKHPVMVVNGKKCIVVRVGDTWESMAKEVRMSKRRLLKLNEVGGDYTPAVGMNIFLEKKAKKADAQYKGRWHKIQQGESMYTISQFYGIRIANLYKMNFKDDTYMPVAGDLLKVR